MKTIKTWINNIVTIVKNNDKLKHLLINFVIVVLVGVFNLKIGVALAIAVSLGKILYDKFKLNSWNWDNVIVDVIGILLGIFIIL